MERYQLRHAAGVYWLLDMEQKGLEYRKPIPMNECGAYIWNCLKSGMTKEALIHTMCREYGIEKEQAGADLEVFLNQLKQCEIEI